MKKCGLVLLTFVPILVGYLINLTLFIPVVGMLLFKILPLCVLVFWFYLGTLYSKTDWHPIAALLIGNATGILSLTLYLWQFLWRSDETRNMFLAGLSQMFSAAVPWQLVGRLDSLFGYLTHTVNGSTMLSWHVISHVLMIGVFTAGYFWKRRRLKKEQKCSDFPQ